MSKSNYYKGLSELPIKRLVEKKGGLDYLSWSNAWDMLKKEHPTAQRIVYECTTWNSVNDSHTTLNYFTDGIVESEIRTWNLFQGINILENLWKLKIKGYGK